MRGKNWASVAAVSALLAGAVVLLSIGAALAGNPWGANYFPNVPLITQDGAAVRFYDDLLKGKSVLFNLIYTSCTDECPLMTAKLVQAQRLLGDRVGRDIFFYSISIDPKRDTPEALKGYAAKFGVGPGWLFLSGKEEDINLVAKKLGLPRRDDAAIRGGHLAILMIGNEPTGRWMKISAAESPRSVATRMSSFLGWRDPQPGESHAEVAKPPAFDAGAYLFQSRCGACHTVGKGDGVGPDLAGVTSRRERGWLVRYLRAPDRMLAEKDPIAVALFAKYKNVPMPNLRLSGGEIASLLSFLEAQSGALHEHEPQDSASAR